jgi:SpoVK/Ycf46/Vps4 family AAA+-type ATPase
MFQHDQLFTKTVISKKSVEACGNIFYEKDLFNPSQKNKQRREKFFWTKNQRELIEGDPKRVLFTSNYGTGKTLVMRAKALHLGEKRQIFYVSKTTADEKNHLGFSESFFLEKSAMKTKKKETLNLNLKNQAIIDPGKTFIILFSKPDALLFHSIHQEFEELKDHVQVICYTG